MKSDVATVEKPALHILLPGWYGVFCHPPVSPEKLFFVPLIGYETTLEIIRLPKGGLDSTIKVIPITMKGYPDAKLLFCGTKEDCIEFIKAQLPAVPKPGAKPSAAVPSGDSDLSPEEILRGD